MQSTYIGCALKRTFEMPSRVHRILQITGEQQLKAIFINLYERAFHACLLLLVLSLPFTVKGQFLYTTIKGTIYIIGYGATNAAPGGAR